MNIIDVIAGRFSSQTGNRNALLIGITGRAGSGKTTLTNKISDRVKEMGIDCVAYSGDWRFHWDSKERKRWLEEKWQTGINEYLYAINQYQWWDFDGIFNDLSVLARGETITIPQAYNRLTGKKDATVEIRGTEKGVVCYENCVLGGIEHLAAIDIIILLNTPDPVCLQRIIKKDTGRRSLSEILSRYLITTYSENIFLKEIFENYPDKIACCDSDGFLGRCPELNEVHSIPVPIQHPVPVPRRKGTVFCDLDGTLIRHVPVPSVTGQEIQVLEGSAEKLQEFREAGYFLVLTTSRPQHKIFGVLKILKEAGIEFDQIICDLPVGPRYLINDSKEGETRAIAIVLERDQGIRSLRLP